MGIERPGDRVTLADKEAPKSRRGLDAFVFEGEEAPALLRPRVIVAIGAVIVVCIGAYVVAHEVLDLSWTINAEPFKNWVQDRGALGPIVFIAVMALSVLFAPIPNVPIFIAAGLAWGPWLGTAYSMAGLVIGSAMAFYAARWLGRRHLARLIGAKMADRLDTLADTVGGRVIFWARMLPAINFDWISIVAGMTSIRFSVFIIYSALGMLIPTGMVVIAGDGLSSNPRVTLLMAGLWFAGIAATGFYFWRRRRRTGDRAIGR
jgi:uncharacterized membrane protein YdjX (TVP38/TMEM64 family)